MVYFCSIGCKYGGRYTVTYRVNSSLKLGLVLFTSFTISIYVWSWKKWAIFKSVECRWNINSPHWM